jgi:hypothetical protein
MRETLLGPLQNVRKKQTKSWYSSMPASTSMRVCVSVAIHRRVIALDYAQRGAFAQEKSAGGMLRFCNSSNFYWDFDEIH